jgi:uncharacterized phage protein gp47/JayE
MADLPVTGAVYPTPDELHAQLLRSLRYAYGRRGVPVNVARGSDLWERSRPVADRVSVAIANGQVELQNTNPVEATGEALTRWAATFGVFPRPASSAIGFTAVEVLPPAITVTVPQGFQATAPDGLKYRTTGPYTVANGGLVQLQATGTGSDTDQEAGTILTWDSAAIGFLGTKSTVDAGGLDGGSDADDEEQLRARLLRKLSFPAVGGNWAHVATLAEDASAAVKVAFVYNAIRGPSSYDVAVMGEPGDPVLGIAVVDQVAAAIVAEMPGSANNNTTTVDQELVDVVLNLGVPLPAHAGGAGGGFYDAEPWPSTNEAPGTFARILSTFGTTINVDSTSADPPVAGKRFSIWNYVDEVMVDFAILSVSGISGNYQITLDPAVQGETGFIETGMYCSASAERLNNYAIDFAAALKQLGPGEKTTNPDILVYGRRKPGFDIEYPQALTSQALTALQSQYSEISDLSFAARRDSGATTTRTTPSIPSTTAGNPRKLTLKYLAFRRQA